MRFLLLLLIAGCDADPPAYSGPRSTLDETAALSAREACTFQAGDPAGLTVAKDARLGKEIPIDTVIVLMMENRSFDHLLSRLPAFGQPDVDVATASATNNDSAGQPVAFHHLDEDCFADTNHEWHGSHVQYNGGAMDGFVISNENHSGGGPDGSRGMGYYDERDVPFLYEIANTFAISDRYFASLLGPTFPNREFLYAGTSYGYTYNKILFDPMNSVMESLETKKVDWRVYSETLPGPAIFLDAYSKYIGDHFAQFFRFFDDAKAGTLAPVVFLDPNLRDDGAVRDDFHPPGVVQLGDEFLSKVTKAVTESPQWNRIVLFIVFDEHGGLYDHVAPPKACPPDDLAPLLESGDDTVATFDRLGFRVPLVVVSPFAKKHYVSHRVYDHTSILRFIEARFELPALTRRDANADPMFDLFDFAKPPFATAPALPTVTAEQKLVDDCVALYPKGDGGIPGM
jgi:phospholipase C